ncbi:universal stress protein [Hyphomonas sp.]|uniref:universal stress protein n=1 Tax=Hyphomonas sp. TaxID=87 RepID=UPI003341B237
MGFRDISVCVSSISPDHDLVDQAAAIAENWNAHLSCCAIGVQPMPVFVDGFGSTQTDVSMMIQASSEELRAFRSDLHRHIEQKTPSVEFRHTMNFINGLAQVTSLFARYADILIARMPDRPDTALHSEIIEGALFGAGRPVLAVPKNWKPRAIGERVLLAWDASREASRAIHSALPVLKTNAEVCIVTVDAHTGPTEHGDVPGLDIAAHLARHDLRVTVRNEDSLGKAVGERLIEAANGFNADMIIMGAYRRPRLLQRITGGPSQLMLTRSPLPVLMSH